jgi:hypothetical protein
MDRTSSGLIIRLIDVFFVAGRPFVNTLDTTGDLT